ncbi:hypothetical protein PV10_06950 [Exophiala mesophila]|uniref:Uncharacterized protein n=1 Tax=Exophiala mesophila TaxID=212818 RepID=A0A0D1WKS8_EXOME|nr:uncharacterized protein PV10_06950 [Exophiala mesophila]KIV89560.1 hypothetical protein PV10_06950 [Exophiala mesophila]
MHLSDIILLSQEDTERATTDIAAIVQSFSLTSPLGALRYGRIPLAELKQWITKGVRADLEHESQYPRITQLGTDEFGLNIERYESLVIEDLDLQPLSSPVDQQLAPNHGQIVAHASFLYHPSNEKRQSSDKIGKEPAISSEANQTNDLPSSGHGELHRYWNQAVETALESEFGDLHCFEVRELSVLAPSHWRKGIASTLLTWIFPFADRIGVPVVLAATPAGYPLYLKHGFVQVSGKNGIVECDMAQWGGSGIHRHVLMSRAPAKQE